MTDSSARHTAVAWFREMHRSLTRFANDPLLGSLGPYRMDLRLVFSTPEPRPLT